MRRVAVEVVRLLMQSKGERGGENHHPVVFHDTRHLRNERAWRRRMLEDLDRQDGIETLALEGQGLAVVEEIGLSTPHRGIGALERAFVFDAYVSVDERSKNGL